MKVTYTSALLGAALFNGAAAYPQVMTEVIKERASETEKDTPSLVKRQLVQPTFNAEEQYVSTSGKYTWVAPGPTDQRGPCPGLNALANHGYLNHNGIGTITDFIESTYQGFGMGRDLGGFLGVYGAIFDGNLESYSIGFASAQLPTISGMLGTPQGLGGSHNKYENDASPIRGDLYTYGNGYLNQVSLFNQFLDLQNDVPVAQQNYDVPLIAAFRNKRFEHSKATNAYFFNGPFSGAIASSAAFSFMYRFMANKSEEMPEGRLDTPILKDFYSMTGDAPNFKYTPGHERFPEQWYKRALNDPYNIPFFIVDAATFFAVNPEFFAIGGNTGKPNTFAAIDPGHITQGVFNFKNLADPNKLGCYMAELGLQSVPDLLEGVFTDVTPAMNLAQGATNKFKDALGANCPPVQLNYAQESLAPYPGYSKNYDGYTAPKKGLLR